MNGSFDPGLIVSLFGRPDRLFHVGHVIAGLEVTLPGADSETETLYQNIIVAERLSHVSPADNRTSAAIADAAGVVKAKRPGHQRRIHGLLLSDITLEVGLGIERTIVMVLHRDLGQDVA